MIVVIIVIISSTCENASFRWMPRRPCPISFSDLAALGAAADHEDYDLHLPRTSPYLPPVERTENGSVLVMRVPISPFLIRQPLSLESTCVCVCARLYIRTYITRVLHVQCNPAVSAGMWKRKHAAYQQRQQMQRRSRVGFTRPFYKCFFWNMPSRDACVHM
jgi:hypothetical protein